MRRFLSALLTLMILLSASAYAATGKETDEDGGVWDYDAGTYTDPEGNVYSIENTDSGSSSGSRSSSPASSSSSGAITVTSSDGAEDPTAGMVKNADGSVTVESGAIQIDEPASEGAHLSQEEWAARWTKYVAANGTTTGTVYMDDAGNIFPAEIVYLGLGRSTVRVDGQELLVPTSSLRWDTEAPEDKVLAVSMPSSQSYLTIRAKKSKKSFVLGHCEKCTVVRVIGTGKTWTMIDDNGVRGYVLTSGLDFHDNSPKTFAAGMITVKGKTPSGNYVHVRSVTGNKSRQIAEYSVGTPVAVFAQDEKWTEIDVGGLHCYIQNQFVTLLEELPRIRADGEPEPGLAPGPEENQNPEPGLAPGPEENQNPEPGLAPGPEA